MAEALIPTFRRFYGTFDAFRATDHDSLLQAPECMTVEAEQIFEKSSLGIGSWLQIPGDLATIGSTF